MDVFSVGSWSLEGKDLSCFGGDEKEGEREGVGE